jgi:hypothetical protein
MENHFAARAVCVARAMAVSNFQVGLEAETADEVAEPMPRINLHDRSKNRMLADGCHWFGTKPGFLLDVHAQTTAKDMDGYALFSRC